MGGLAEQAIDRATEAYRTRDAKFCQMVFTGETAINQAERDIDELALDLLAMQQPMAIDLRFIMAVIKINADLERVGDQAVNIAQRVLDLISEPQVEFRSISQMASQREHHGAAGAGIVSRWPCRGGRVGAGDGQHRRPHEGRGLCHPGAEDASAILR